MGATSRQGEDLLHPNDHVNLSQSSNDTFPTALHIAAATALHRRLFPALEEMLVCLQDLENANGDVVKTGRTHLQDAVPITFGQEISGWRSMLEHSRDMVTASLDGLYELALGGTAVGTGLNAPPGFDTAAAQEVAQRTGLPFRTAPNKFHALTAKDALVFTHGALKALAANLMKIANDVRWLASGPRCGLGEIFIPENEPGSSIMPWQGQPHPVRGPHHGGRPGDGERHGDRHRRLPRQLRTQRLHARAGPQLPPVGAAAGRRHGQLHPPVPQGPDPPTGRRWRKTSIAP